MAKDTKDKTPETAPPAATLLEQLRDDLKNEFKQNWVIFWAIVGLLLLVGGSATLYVTEESTLDVVRATLRSEKADKEVQTNDRGEDYLSPHHRAVVRFVAEIFGVRIGELLLIGCFLESILHSDHYGKFFLNLVEQAMLGERIIARLGNSAELWTRISEIYFSEKFPKIHRRLSDTLYDYFPTTHKYYLNDYKLTLKIRHEEGNFFTVSREMRYTAVPATATERVPFKFEGKLRKRGGAGDRTQATLLAVCIDDIDLTKKYAFTEKADGGASIIELKVEEDMGTGECEVKVLMESTQDIEFDPYDGFTISSLINNLTVLIEYPDKMLNIQWLDIGVKDAFKPVYPGRIAVVPGRIDKKYEGLIFKNQGFRLVLRKVVPDGQ